MSDMYDLRQDLRECREENKALRDELAEVVRELEVLSERDFEHWSRHCDAEKEVVALHAKLKDREARLKTVRVPVSGGLAELCACSDGSCAWCRAYRATDLRVKDWRSK